MLRNLRDINTELQNEIQWEMTPEEAIALHLEWGPLRNQAYYNSRDSENETIYFIINTWKSEPQLQLVKRKGFDMETIGKFKLPRRLQEFYGGLKGVFTPDKATIVWIKDQLK